MAEAPGLSLRTVQRIWKAHKLQPHRLRTFKRSRDPNFEAKLTDIVGLYMDPPAHASQPNNRGARKAPKRAP